MKPEISAERTPAARVATDAGGAPARRSPMLSSGLVSSLGRHLPRAAASAAELETLRRRAWRQDGVLSLRDGDDRLTWPERELVRQLGERLYGDRPASLAPALAPPAEEA